MGSGGEIYSQDVQIDFGAHHSTTREAREEVSGDLSFVHKSNRFRGS